MDDEFIPLAEFPLEPEETEDSRGGYLSPSEGVIFLRGHPNRMGISVRKPVPVVTDDVPAGHVACDVALMLVLHAHPKCRFTWSRLIVDLSATPEVKIQDMVPSEVEEVPVEIETKIGAGLKFATVLKAVDIEVNPELARKRTVHFPTVLASGTGFTQAYWDFTAGGDTYLHVNRELRLLVTAPAGSPIEASFKISAEARMNGLPGILRLRGKNGCHGSTVTLVEP
jgi:hypothetical protein